MISLSKAGKMVVDFACSVCAERHKERYGHYPDGCAYKSFDDMFCPNIMNAIAKQPDYTIDDRPHARWVSIIFNEGDEFYACFKCSNCGKKVSEAVAKNSEYCLGCAAKMDNCAGLVWNESEAKNESKV